MVVHEPTNRVARSGCMTFLDDIIRVKGESIQGKKGRRFLQEMRSRVADAEPTRPFEKALSARDENAPKLIAEIKKASPSAGVIRADFRPVDIAKTYEEGGAAALSILTEEHYFQGSLSYVQEVRSNVLLPILQKDFILDECQIYEARAIGADAVLLIAALLETGQMRDYFDLAKNLSLDVLVEVHHEKELEGVVAWAPLIGINNRDLHTFKTDLATTFRLLREIPDNKTVVSESGIRLREDVKQLFDAGVDAMLIGELLMASHQIGETMKALLEPIGEMKR